MLEFDFIPENDTVIIRFRFASEGYDNQIGMIYNDVCGVFLTGPNPQGGIYPDKNIALVPGTDDPVGLATVNNGYASSGSLPQGPCVNCQSYFSNPSAGPVSFDGYTALLTGALAVTPYEIYHIKLGVADVGSYGFDSGIFFPAHNLFSPGEAEFTAFRFAKEDNPQLPWDVEGVIEGDQVTLVVPEGTDLTALIAGWEDKGAFVYIDGVMQESGITPNDFTEPLVYHLDGKNSADYLVTVETTVGLEPQTEYPEQVTVTSSREEIIVYNARNAAISVYTVSGKLVSETMADAVRYEIPVAQTGLFLVKIDSEQQVVIRKIFVR
ncbi:MAG: hypothetical protein Kow00127_09960 [Bacteroidales bacterium]